MMLAFVRGAVMRLAIVAACVCVTASPAVQAIDTFQKQAQNRPENLDLSTTVTSAGRYFSATYRFEGACPPLNKIHRWVIALTDKEGDPMSGVELVVSAGMPEHLHGMTTMPEASELSTPGVYVVKGMNFHMPGWWKLTLDASRGTGRDLAYFNIVVGEGYCHRESQ